MRHVLFVADNLSYGGAQKMMTFVANNLDRSQFRVSLLNESSDIPVARPIKEDIMVYGHPRYTQKGVRRIKEIIFLMKLIQDIRPDVLVSFLDMPNFITTFCGWVMRVPVVISERGDPAQKMSTTDRFMRNFEKKAVGAVFQTEGAKQYYPKEIQNKSVVIENPVVPVALSEDFEYRDDVKNIAFVGRFENVQKRQDLAVEAFAEVCLQTKDVVLNFYGNGPDENYIREMAIRRGVADRIVFHGKTANPQEELLKNDMYLITSDYEGIPNTLIEAMAVGMPCVATDCSPGGAALLIKNEENGLLVPRGDKQKIANAIMRFICDPGFAHSCGKQAKTICERYTPESIISKWNILLGRLCK